MRNIFQHGRSLRWEQITQFQEEELPMHKRSYVTIRLSNRGAADVAAPTRLVVTSDQVGFETLRTIIREAVGTELV